MQEEKEREEMRDHAKSVKFEADNKKKVIKKIEEV